MNKLDKKLIKIYTDYDGNVIIIYRENGIKKKAVINNFVPYYWIKENNTFKKRLYDYSNRYNIEAKGTYELDVPPHQLFLIENDCDFEDDYKVLYFDIETKDTSGDIEIGAERVMSICAIDNNGKEFIFCDDDEKKMLEDFKSILLDYDILAGWNSMKFDVPYLKIRFKINNIRFNFKDINCIDMMKCVMENYTIKNILTRATSSAKSFSLNNIAKILLKETKLELEEDSGYGGRLFNLFINDREKLIDYNMQDVRILEKLDKKFLLIDVQKQLCLLGKINMEDTQFYSRVVDLILLKEAAKINLHFPSRQKDIEKATYPGALTLQPTAGLFEDVAIFDFASLYANIVMAYNISPETLLDDNYEGSCIISPLSKTKFMNFSDKIGFVPALLIKYTKMKKELQTELNKIDKKSNEYVIKHLRRDATKVLILTAYGIFGSAYSRYFNLKVASTITEVGRYLLQNVSDNLNKNNFKVLAGDTDSLFVKVNNFENIRVVDKLIKEYLSTLDSSVKKELFDMKFEKYLKKIILTAKNETEGAKKKYVSRCINDGGQECDFIYSRGSELGKKDTTMCCKRLLNELINLILYKEATKENCIEIVEKYKLYILNDKVDVEDLIITKRVSKMIDKYKNPSAHVKLAFDRVQKGERFYVGQQIPYVVMKNSPLEIVHFKDYSGNFDRRYYWNNQIFPPAQRILESVFKEHDWEQYLEKIEKQKKLKLK